MKTSYFIVAVLLFAFISAANAQKQREIGNLVMEDIPEIPEDIKNRIQQYQNTRSVIFLDWLPDDQGILMSTRFGNTNQIHIVNKPGGARNQTIPIV